MSQRPSGSAATAVPVLLLGLGLVAGCAPGAAAGALRPDDPTAKNALGEGGGACHEVDNSAEPLVVDWKPEQRGDLEEAMHDGVAVVAYSCAGMKLLKECHIDGKYGFLGMTRREQVVRLQNSDEVRANLPLTGGALAGKIGGELGRGTTLDIAMVMIGKKRTTWATPTRDDLKGTCDGATHFVRGAVVGAFVLETGSKAHAKIAGEMFGVQAGGGSESEKSVRNTDGDPGDCQKASPDSEKAPPQCGAAVRLVLGPLGPSTKTPDGKVAEPKAAAPAVEKVAAPENACPKGLVFTEGKCAEVANAPAYQCASGDEQGCAAQCDKGHAGSCATLGALYAGGGKVARDYAKALPVLKKACDGGEPKGCLNLAILTAEGRGATKDETAAAALFDKACTAGDATACRWLGRATLDGRGVTADPARAAGLLQKACAGGDDGGCATAGRLFAEGKGVTADPAKAADFWKRACDGTDADSCDRLGQLYETGVGARKDPIVARMMYQRGCFRASGASCADLGRMELGGFGGAGEGAAKRAFDMACNWRDTLGCAALKVLFGDSRPVFPDVARQQQMVQSCHGGNARDCASAGLLDVASNNKAQGLMTLDMACQRGEGFACAVAKKAH